MCFENKPWNAFGGSESDWRDWRWQQQHAVQTLRELERWLRLTVDEVEGVEQRASQFPLRVTPYYLSLADRDDPFCPIRMQIVPRPAECRILPGELADPLAEDTHKPVPRLIHRYPDRVLYLALNVCSVHCRHCTRRRLTGKKISELGSLERAVEYVRSRREVRDVLISGGDPFMFSNERLEHILAEFRAIPHVEVLRIGTRMPVCNPMRIDNSLTAMLRRYNPLFVMTHFNHPKEVTSEARRACEQLVDAGIPVENQSVLMRQLNSSPRIIKDLCHKLLTMRVRPYYLHQMDVAQGLEHLRTPISCGMEIVGSMRGNTSGFAIPSFAIDLPGGGGKVTLQPDCVVSARQNEVALLNYRKETFVYPEPSENDCNCPYEEKYYGGLHSSWREGRD